MTDYVLQVNYREDEEPLRIPLLGCDPDAAETAHQALERRIEHALEIKAPLIYSEASDENPTAGVPIDPTRVTGVDLLDPDE